MKAWTLLTLGGLAGLLLLAAGCREGGAAPAVPTPTADVLPITFTQAHCFTCHTRGSSIYVPLGSDITQKPMTHPVAQREDCLVCHATREKYPFPSDHAQALSQACLTCHSPAHIPSTEEALPLTDGSWASDLTVVPQ